MTVTVGHGLVTLVTVVVDTSTGHKLKSDSFFFSVNFDPQVTRNFPAASWCFQPYTVIPAWLACMSSKIRYMAMIIAKSKARWSHFDCIRVEDLREGSFVKLPAEKWWQSRQHCRLGATGIRNDREDIDSTGSRCDWRISVLWRLGCYHDTVNAFIIDLPII